MLHIAIDYTLTHSIPCLLAQPCSKTSNNHPQKFIRLHTTFRLTLFTQNQEYAGQYIDHIFKLDRFIPDMDAVVISCLFVIMYRHERLLQAISNVSELVIPLLTQIAHAHIFLLTADSLGFCLHIR